MVAEMSKIGPPEDRSTIASSSSQFDPNGLAANASSESSVDLNLPAVILIRNPPRANSSERA